MPRLQIACEAIGKVAEIEISEAKADLLIAQKFIYHCGGCNALHLAAPQMGALSLWTDDAVTFLLVTLLGSEPAGAPKQKPLPSELQMDNILKFRNRPE